MVRGMAHGHHRRKHPRPFRESNRGRLEVHASSFGNPTSLPVRKTLSTKSARMCARAAPRVSGTERLAIAPEEGGLRQRRERGTLLAEPDDDRRTAADFDERV